MTEEEKANLFNRFTQANQRTFFEYGGSGLGLVLSKAMVEQMGGEIKLETEKGRGTTFLVTVEFQTATESNETDMLAIEEKISESNLKKRILVVEDNAINQRVLQRHMENYGCKCVIANNGREGLDTYIQSAQEFDLILMDIEMPEMNGLDSTKAIRQYEKENGLARKLIIGLSGNARQEHIDNAIAFGMDTYVVKPYKKEDLVRTILRYSS